MSSTINGSAGAANNGAIVSAITLLNGRPNGIQTSDVVASGNFSLKGLPAGTYQVKIVLNNGTPGDSTGADVSNVLNNPVVIADGTSTYSI